MYRWRAISACARVVFPDVITGIYTPDEMGAEVNLDGEVVAIPKPNVRQITPQPATTETVLDDVEMGTGSEFTGAVLDVTAHPRQNNNSKQRTMKYSDCVPDTPRAIRSKWSSKTLHEYVNTLLSRSEDGMSSLSIGSYDVLIADSGISFSRSESRITFTRQCGSERRVTRAVKSRWMAAVLTLKTYGIGGGTRRRLYQQSRR